MLGRHLAAVGGIICVITVLIIVFYWQGCVKKNAILGRHLTGVGGISS
jgi:hypothetical protein